MSLRHFVVTAKYTLKLEAYFRVPSRTSRQVTHLANLTIGADQRCQRVEKSIYMRDREFEELWDKPFVSIQRG
jgi:hypothetical protein